MSRPLRIEYPGAWYHVMNRGRRREDIFLDESDYHLFLDVLKDTAKMWNLKVSAYCLMSNHYHLLVQTPEGNLSRCMRHLNGVYTQRFNLKHGLDGQLFRGRYKSVLVEEDNYLLELLRYIHRNPLEAGIVTKLNDYPWSSHRGYLEQEKGWSWLHRNMLLEMFSKTRKQAFSDYLTFVTQQDSDEIEHFFSHKNLPSIFGSSGFIDKIRNRFGFLRHNHEITDVAILSVDVKEVITVTCRVCNISEPELLTSRRGVTNIPKDLAIYTLRRYSQKTLAEIGKAFEVGNYSTVSTSIERTKKTLKEDPKVNRLWQEIIYRLQVSQQQT